MKKIIILSLLFAFALSVSGGAFLAGGLPGPVTAYAEEDWKKEFDDVCAKTQDSEQLGKDELQRLVTRCDALKTRFEKFEDPQRKVMLSRLKRCRDFFDYMLQMKEKK